MSREWRPLDLRRADSRPRDGELVALKLIPAGSRARSFDRTQYDIGFFRPDGMTKSPKLWWLGAHGVDDPIRMKKHHDIWWYPLPDDGAN